MSQRNEFHEWFSTSVPFQITKLWETHKYPAHPPSLDFSFHSTTYFLLSKSTQKNSKIALFLLYMLHSTSQRSGKHISTLSIPRLWPFRFYQPLLPAIQEHLKCFSIVLFLLYTLPYNGLSVHTYCRLGDSLYISSWVAIYLIDLMSQHALALMDITAMSFSGTTIHTQKIATSGSTSPSCLVHISLSSNPACDFFLVTCADTQQLLLLLCISWPSVHRSILTGLPHHLAYLSHPLSS